MPTNDHAEPLMQLMRELAGETQPPVRVFVPTVAKYAQLETTALYDALKWLEDCNRIELRTDDNLDRFDDSDLELCPETDDGFLIVWVKLL